MIRLDLPFPDFAVKVTELHSPDEGVTEAMESVD